MHSNQGNPPHYKNILPHDTQSKTLALVSKANLTPYLRIDALPVLPAGVVLATRSHMPRSRIGLPSAAHTMRADESGQARAHGQALARGAPGEHHPGDAGRRRRGGRDRKSLPGRRPSPAASSTRPLPAQDELTADGAGCRPPVTAVEKAPPGAALGVRGVSACRSQLVDAAAAPAVC